MFSVYGRKHWEGGTTQVTLTRIFHVSLYSHHSNAGITRVHSLAATFPTPTATCTHMTAYKVNTENGILIELTEDEGELGLD